MSCNEDSFPRPHVAYSHKAANWTSYQQAVRHAPSGNHPSTAVSQPLPLLQLNRFLLFLVSTSYVHWFISASTKETFHTLAPGEGKTWGRRGENPF